MSDARLTYRKALNRGWMPHWYHTDRGIIVACIEKEARLWMYLRLTDGSRKRVRLSEKKYMTPFKSKRG